MSGTGLLIIKRVKLPFPWKIVVASLLGIQTFSLGVQVFAISQIASHFILISYAVSFTVLGLIGFTTFIFQTQKNSLKFNKISFRFHWFWLIYFAMILTLIMAAHGSTKIDEIHYHMLLPARIVADGGLHFYQMPWQSAILPQMTYQLAMAPFHAMGFIHVGNIISWFFSILMLWAAMILVWNASKSISWSALTISPIAVGIYPTIWHVTSGAHALGDISVVFTIIALVQFESFRRHLGTTSIVLLISFLTVSAATTKVSMLPFSLLVLFFVILKTKKYGYHFIFISLIPWLIFYAPICLWTWVESGSPFGPVLTSFFGSKVYDLTEIQNIIESSQILSRTDLSEKLKYAIVSYSPLVWVFTVYLFILKGSPRLIPVTFILLQLFLIATILPFNLRFLSGTQFAAVIIFGIYGYPRMSWLTKSSSMVKVVLLLGTLPWLAIQSIYVTPFAKYLAGITSKNDFNKRYIAFYEDYMVLNSLLPKNATLLVKGIYLNSIYAPRNVFFSEEDLPPGRPSFLFKVAKVHSELDQKIIYENKSSTVLISRTPGKPSKIDKLIVSARKK